MDTLLQDLKHSLRMFRQHPVFTFAAIATLALGIGANTAIFSVVNAVLLAPLKLQDPDRIVQLRTISPQGVNQVASPAKFAYWRTLDDILDNVSATRFSAVNYGTAETAEQLYGEKVSADYFDLYGARIVHGRGFTAEEDSPGSPLSAVLGHAFWERRFAADADVLGQTILLRGVPHTVVGVINSEFTIEEFRTSPPDVFIPIQLDPNSTDQAHSFFVGGKLKPGLSLEQAQARLAASTEAYRERFPQFGADQVFTVVSMREALVSGARESLLLLMGAVGLVLLIACANVASLLLARAAGRRREIAIRSAIGAGRGRIIRQLLTESVLLATVAGGVGLAIGSIGIEALLSINTAGLPRLGSNGAIVPIDWRVMSFALGASAVTGILFGLIPAVQGSRTDLSGALKQGGGRSGSAFRQDRARSLLIVTEVALAVVLLVAATLLIRSSMALSNVDPGFDANNVLGIRMSLADQRFASTISVERMVQNGIQRIESLPGVEAAGTTCCLPLQGAPNFPFVVAGRPLENADHGRGGWTTISPGYFDVFKIPVRRGRSFDARDGSAGPPVVIINEAMARRFWPETDPLNDRLIIGSNVIQDLADEPERQIVGIVGDARDSSLNTDPVPRMYVPSAQLSDGATVLHSGFSPMTWIVRTAAASAVLTEQIQTEIRQVSGLPLYSVISMEDLVDYSLSRQRFNTWLMTVFGGLALLLAAIGIYGLMAYSVQQRTQEIGIRLALGARVNQIRAMVVSQGMKLAVAGVIVGIAAALALSQVISSFLFGVEARDPLTFVVVPLFLAAIALIAVWIPARRASRLDPLEALRHE